MTPETTSVVILSAGHGTRMLPLTQDTPKPLLKVGEHSLIEHHLIRLHALGFRQIVINIAYLGNRIRNALGDGSNYGLSITYSDEADTGALETAGGLKAALPLIQSDPFLVINADIWTNFDFTKLLTPLSHLARLVMVNNPDHNLDGDFGLSGDFGLPDSESALLNNSPENRATFSGIALYQKSLFNDLKEGKQALGPVFRKLIEQERIEGIKHNGLWKDIGTPERLAEINLLHELN